MKRLLFLIIPFLLAVLILTSCNNNSSGLNVHDPVVLSMWHVYGEQADSPMNQLVNEFNETVGLENGIIINVTAITNSTVLDSQLQDAKAGLVGAEKFPDLFFCHTNSAVVLGADTLLDWNDWFTDQELDSFSPSFLDDGMVDSALSVLPITKSTHILFLNGSLFQRFSADTGITVGDLATWDGFFRTAEAFYNWSDGIPFCALDFPLRAVELNAASHGTPVQLTDNWYDFSDPALRSSWMEFANALVRGHIVVSDLFSNTQVMTGEVAAGLGSSAAILYFNDTVTYRDNSTEPMKLITLPMPAAEGGTSVSTRSGVGLCAAKSTPEKAKAASLFAHWLTEDNHNLDLAAQTGYMPANTRSFTAIGDYPFPDESYSNLYHTLEHIQSAFTSIPESNSSSYYQRIARVYDALRSQQAQWAQRYRNGVPVEELTEESWQIFSSIH